MELELLHGIFSRLGQYWVYRDTSSKQVSRHQHRVRTQINGKIIEQVKEAPYVKNFARRDAFLAEKYRPPKEKSDCCSLDSGYSSLMESGYSSHRESKSSSPVPGLVDHGPYTQTEEWQEKDRRERVWLVCQTGVLPARVCMEEKEEEPNTQLHNSLRELSLHTTAAAESDTENKSIKHKHNFKLCDDVPEYKTKVKTKDKVKHCDDIRTTKHSKPNYESKENKRISIHESQEKEKDVNGLVKVQLEDSRDVLEVDRRFIEKAGPKSEEHPDDLQNAGELNESELLSILAGRFSSGEYQTMVGDSCMLSINPMRRTDSGCGRTTRKTRQQSSKTGLDILLQQVETVYRRAISTSEPQSLILTGRSGSGKTCNFKKALGYLIDTTQPDTEPVFTGDKMYAIDCLLESFCSTRTTLNTHATRMVQMVQLHFDQEGKVVGGGVEMAMPDVARLLRTGRRAGEPTFPILYQVQAALGKSNLFLPPRMLVDNAFFTPLQDEMEIATALEDWSRVCVAMEVLGVEQEEEEAFWLILAAITNLGVIAKQMEDSNNYHSDPSIVAKISEILGVSQDDFKKVVTRPATPRTISPASSLTPSSASSRASSPSRSTTSSIPVLSPNLEQQHHTPWPQPDGSPLVLDNVCRLAVNLYSELLTRLVSLINRSIHPNTAKQSSSLILFDSPGFQNPCCVGDKPDAGFVELCYNYLQERLQLLFCNSQIEQLAEKDRCVAKLLVSKKTTSSPMINLIDRTNPTLSPSSKSSWTGSSHTLGRRSSKRVRFTQAPPGLYTLLHKATNCPWSDDQTFVQRLTAHWVGQGNGSLIDSSGDTQFTLHHLQGTNSVRYNALGWRHISYCMGRTNLATEILRKSARPELKSGSQDPLISSPIGGATGLTLEELKAKMSCLQVKVQVDTMMKVLSGTKVNFIVCMQPHHLAGLCELFRKSPGRNLNQKLLRDQLRGHQVLDFLLSLKELGRVQQVVSSSKMALGELVTKHSDSLVVSDTQHQPSPGLASNLWQGLQVAVISAVSQIDMMETAMTGISKSITMPASSMASRVLDDTGLLLLENGRVSLNLDCLGTGTLG